MLAHVSTGRVSDIDECGIMHGVCGDGECQNLPGTFTCKCKEGYETSQLMQVCMGNITLLDRKVYLHTSAACLRREGRGTGDFNLPSLRKRS